MGLLPALMVKMASHVSARYASYMVLFIAFFSHISSDAALVIMPPLGALIKASAVSLAAGLCTGLAPCCLTRARDAVRMALARPSEGWLN